MITFLIIISEKKCDFLVIIGMVNAQCGLQRSANQLRAVTRQLRILRIIFYEWGGSCHLGFSVRLKTENRIFLHTTSEKNLFPGFRDTGERGPRPPSLFHYLMAKSVEISSLALVSSTVPSFSPPHPPHPPPGPRWASRGVVSAEGMEGILAGCSHGVRVLFPVASSVNPARNLSSKELVPGVLLPGARRSACLRCTRSEEVCWFLEDGKVFLFQAAHFIWYYCSEKLFLFVACGEWLLSLDEGRIWVWFLSFMAVKRGFISFVGMPEWKRFTSCPAGVLSGLIANIAAFDKEWVLEIYKVNIFANFIGICCLSSMHVYISMISATCPTLSKHCA